MRWHFPNGSSFDGDLEDVWHVPDIERQFISFVKLLEVKDSTVNFVDRHMYVLGEDTQSFAPALKGALESAC